MRPILLSTLLLLCSAAPAPDPEPILFNTSFESASLGKVEKLSATSFRLHVKGQSDERGRNRQASWFHFRMDRVNGRDLTLTLTDFVGEYNDTPGACPAGPDIVPVFSTDAGRTWTHFAAGQVKWDDAKKEQTLTFRPESDSIHVAHIAPYTTADVARLLDAVRPHPHVLIEVIGHSTQGRPIYMVTVTDPTVPDADKRHLWLQSRQHAWEAGTSHVMDGALRFVTSDAPQAVELRKRNLFRFTPMPDPDGVFAGNVRFNPNGYDTNRHWPGIDLRTPRLLALMPETWYAKKAILAAHAAKPIDLLVNMHNTETNEYLESAVTDGRHVTTMRRLADLLEKTTFDPHRPITIRNAPTTTTNSLAAQHGVPAVLMELRIGTGRKLTRRPAVEDRYAFAAHLLPAMAEAVR